MITKDDLKKLATHYQKMGSVQTAIKKAVKEIKKAKEKEKAEKLRASITG